MAAIAADDTEEVLEVLVPEMLERYAAFLMCSPLPAILMGKMRFETIGCWYAMSYLTDKPMWLRHPNHPRKRSKKIHKLGV